MNIRLLSEQGESEYLSTPSSGRGTGEIIITKNQIVETLKPIALRKPMAMIVGSVATQGQSNNDIDIVIRGEDFSDKIKEAISFRLYRYFSEMLKCSYDDTPKYVHLHWNNTGSYTSYIPLFELSLVPLTNREVVHMNAMPVNITGNFNIIQKAKEGKGPRIIAGYASVIEVDEQDQLIPKATLENGIQTLLSNSEYSNLMLVHKNIQIGKILSNYNEMKTHVDEKGLFIVAEIRNDLEIANKLWECILNGDLNSFSIAGEVLLSHDECDDKKCVKVIDKLNIFEVSVCSSPVNTNSGFVIVSKSHDNTTKVCQDVNNTKEKIDSMVENKEVKKDEPCTDCVPPTDTAQPAPEVKKEISVVDAIDSINRELTALKGVLDELKAKPQEGQPMDETPVPAPQAESPIDQPAEATSDTDMVLAEFAQFVVQYLAANPGKTPEEIMAAWKDKKNPQEQSPEAPVPPPEQQPAPETPSNYPYPEKKDFDNLKQAFDDLVAKMDKSKKTEDFEIALKAKDDEFKALMKKVEILEKSEVPPKTTVEVIHNENVVTNPSDMKVEIDGSLTKEFEGNMRISEPKDIPVVKDLLNRGVFTKDPDYS